MKTYTFDDVVNTLNQVQPYDWRGFLTDRVLKIAEHAPLGGITNGGWMLVYTDQPNRSPNCASRRGVASTRGVAGAGAHQGRCGGRRHRGRNRGEERHWAGDEDHRRQRAKILAEFLAAAMREAQRSHQPIQLLVENTEYYRTVSLGLLRRAPDPHLVRDMSKPDLFGDIIRPKVTTLPQPFQGAE